MKNGICACGRGEGEYTVEYTGAGAQLRATTTNAAVWPRLERDRHEEEAARVDAADRRDPLRAVPRGHRLAHAVEELGVAQEPADVVEALDAFERVVRDHRRGLARERPVGRVRGAVSHLGHSEIVVREFDERGTLVDRRGRQFQ